MTGEEKRDFYVYVDITEDEGIPFYVGKGTIARVNDLQRNRKHSNIAGKHGSQRILILENVTEREAFDKEIELIADCQTNAHRHPENHYACNFTDGGEGISGLVHSEESRKKMSDNSGSRREDVRKKMSDAAKGKRKSPETCRRMSDAKKSQKCSPEHCAAIKYARQFYRLPPRSVEHNLKISITRRKNYAIRLMKNVLDELQSEYGVTLRDVSFERATV